MALANPKLSDLITRSIGDGWLTQTNELKKLEPFAEDAAFRQEWRAVKQGNKEKLAAYIRKQTGIELDPTWMFDIQVKRIHEYKRQHLNVLHIITLYCRLKRNPGLTIPHGHLFSAARQHPVIFWPSVSSNLSPQWAKWSITTRM